MATYTEGESNESIKERKVAAAKLKKQEEIKTIKIWLQIILFFVLAFSLTCIYCPEVFQLALIIIGWGILIGSVLAIIYLICAKKPDGTENSLFLGPIAIAFLISIPLAFMLKNMGIAFQKVKNIIVYTLRVYDFFG